jgi:Na+-transporting NADH:ubiquinone oxidoreductase subunit B
MGFQDVPELTFTLLSGALMYAAVFMVTDPVSAPKKPLAQYTYAAFIGVMIVFLRWRSSFVGAVAFGILLGNLIAPLLDEGAGWLAARKKARAEAAKQAASGGDA